MLAVALTWASGLPRDPMPLLRSFSMVSWSIFGLDGISVVRRLESGRSEWLIDVAPALPISTKWKVL